MASIIRVEPQSLSGDALDLASAVVPIVVPVAVSPAADPVSPGVTGVLEAHSAALSTVVEHSGALRAHGGAVLAQSAASLQAANEDSAATLAAVAGVIAPAAGSSVASLPVPAAPPEVMLPEIPALTPPPMLPGDVLSKLIHGGPGWSGLLDFADAWRAHAATLDDLADQVVFGGAAIDERWVDGQQRAGANTREHGYWLRDSADRARTIAAAAADVADHFDTARNATPTPEEFQAARQEFTAAQARRDPIGVAQATRKYTNMHAQAVNAAMAYHGGATSPVNKLGTPLQTAPAIARGGPAIQPVDSGGYYDPNTGERTHVPPAKTPDGQTPYDPQTGVRNIGPVPPVVVPAISAKVIALAEAAGFTAEEAGVIAEADEILGSDQMAEIVEAHAEGKPLEVVINDRTIQYEPGAPTAGMSLFGENGFVIGNEAFASPGELDPTVLHELYRLATSVRAQGVGAGPDTAPAEMPLAANFASRAYDFLRQMGLQ